MVKITEAPSKSSFSGGRFARFFLNGGKNIFLFRQREGGGRRKTTDRWAYLLQKMFFARVLVSYAQAYCTVPCVEWLEIMGERRDKKDLQFLSLFLHLPSILIFHNSVFLPLLASTKRLKVRRLSFGRKEKQKRITTKASTSAYCAHAVYVRIGTFVRRRTESAHKSWGKRKMLSSRLSKHPICSFKKAKWTNCLADHKLFVKEHLPLPTNKIFLIIYSPIFLYSTVHLVQ